MKIGILFLNIILLLQSVLSPSFTNIFDVVPSYEATIENLGIPLYGHYSDDAVSRSPWDIEIFENKLFVGGGDYDKNTGPVPVYYYDLINSAWNLSGTVPDEQIEFFKIINGELLIPGCDPKQSWDYGNIYEFQDANWIVNRNIPGGIHLFDMTQYDKMIFAATGVLPGESPISISYDGGTTFQQIPLYKNGTLLDTSTPDDPNITSYIIRAHNFFHVNGNLFAFISTSTNLDICKEIYLYSKNAFHYVSNLPDNIKAKRLKYHSIYAGLEYNGRLYFTTGNLYTTDDFKTAKQIKISNNAAITDLQVINNQLYLIATEKTNDNTFRNSLWQYNILNNTFYEVFYFNFSCPILSFTYWDNVYYFGAGHGLLNESCSQCGSILSVELNN